MIASRPTDEFTQAAHDFTLRKLFFGDMLLNWFLGVALAALPGVADRLLSTGPPVLPPVAYRLIGFGFLAFAAWQTSVIVRRRLTPAALAFACLLAEIPVVLLAVALLFMGLPLKPFWRALLWVGNGYMLLLGAWYLFLARRLWIAGRRSPVEAGG